MPDYGRDLTFGYFLIPNAAAPLLDTAREIEARGLDWIGVQDHPYQRRFVDTWALLGAIAAAQRLFVESGLERDVDPLGGHPARVELAAPDPFATTTLLTS